MIPPQIESPSYEQYSLSPVNAALSTNRTENSGPLSSTRTTNRMYTNVMKLKSNRAYNMFVNASNTNEEIATFFSMKTSSSNEKKKNQMKTNNVHDEKKDSLCTSTCSNCLSQYSDMSNLDGAYIAKQSHNNNYGSKVNLFLGKFNLIKNLKNKNSSTMKLRIPSEKEVDDGDITPEIYRRLVKAKSQKRKSVFLNLNNFEEVKRILKSEPERPVLPILAKHPSVLDFKKIINNFDSLNDEGSQHVNSILLTLI